MAFERSPCKGIVDEVMRSCGGAVQGLTEDLDTLQQEERDDGRKANMLNRQDDGFCFFDCGSFVQGPTTTAGDSPFQLWVSLSQDEKANSRSCLRLYFEAAKLQAAKIAVLQKVRTGDNADKGATLAEDGRLSDLASLDLEGMSQLTQLTQASGAPWLAPRLKWKGITESENQIFTERPGDVTLLPGGHWVRIDGSCGLEIEVGVLVPANTAATVGAGTGEPIEMRSITRDYDATGSLQLVEHRSVRIHQSLSRPWPG